MFASSCIHT